MGEEGVVWAMTFRYAPIGTTLELGGYTVIILGLGYGGNQLGKTLFR
jgi:hypothetical protein